MLDIRGIKKKSREQLKGNYITALAAAVIQMGIIFALQLAAAHIPANHQNLSFGLSIANLIITSITSFAFYCLCTRIVQGDTISLYDFTEGFAHIKPAVLGNLWKSFCLWLWCLLIMVPLIILTVILITTSISSFNWADLLESGFHFSETITSSDGISELVSTSIISVLMIFFVTIGLIVILIFKTLQYSLCTAILAENKKMSVTKALRLSIILTKGHKGDILGLILGFIPWFLLVFIPAFILREYSHNIYLINLSYCATSAFIMPYYVTSLINAYNKIKSEAIASSKLKIEDFQ